MTHRTYSIFSFTLFYCIPVKGSRNVSLPPLDILKQNPFSLPFSLPCNVYYAGHQIFTSFLHFAIVRQVFMRDFFFFSNSLYSFGLFCCLFVPFTFLMVCMNVLYYWHWHDPIKVRRNSKWQCKNILIIHFFVKLKRIFFSLVKTCASAYFIM